MKALLVRIGIDQTYGGWNSPVDSARHLFYVPIPEERDAHFHVGLERRYDEVLPALEAFCRVRNRNLYEDLRFPPELRERPMHLDPDFEYLTYGDVGSRRGAGMVNIREGDLLVFYAALRPVYFCEHKLIYALVGMYVVHEVMPVASVSYNRWHENAHVRAQNRGETDIVVWAKPDLSGRFDRCIPIGEWRNGAYRVRHEILDAWGGLSVKDGFIQRSAVPPTFNNPTRFLDWLQKQNIEFIHKNN